MTCGGLVIEHANGNAALCLQNKIVDVDVAPVARVDERDWWCAYPLDDAGAEQVVQPFVVDRYAQDAAPGTDRLMDDAALGEVDNVDHNVGPTLGLIPAFGGPEADVHHIGLM